MKAVLSVSKINARILILIILLLSGYGFTCMATTWYISPSGDDATGDGSIGNPWKTLHFATQNVTAPGDIIFVKQGTYLETAQCHLSPGVSIEGDSTNLPVIQTTDTTIFRELLSLKSPEGTNGDQHISYLKFDGQNMTTYWAIWIAGRSNVSIYNCIVENFRDRGVIFSARSDFYEYPPDTLYSTGNKFFNNIINNCAEYSDSVTGTYGRGCLNIGGQIGMQIYNNVITQNQRPEGHNGWPIKYTNHGYLKECRIFNNTLTKIPYGGTYPGQSGWDFCIELFNAEGLEISGNIIHGSIDLNFNRKGAYNYSAWIHHNQMSRDTLNTKFESGIIFEFGTESAIVEYNILNRVATGVQFNTRDSSIVKDCIIRKNLFANLGSGDSTGTPGGGIIFASEGTNNATIQNILIDNNTIVAAPDHEPWIGIDFSSISNGSATNIKIRNNIVVGFPYTWLLGSDTTNMDNVHLLFNDSYKNGYGDAPMWPGGDPTNYIDTPYNLRGIDPMFDSITNTFSLQSISPLIDLGIIITDIPYLGVGPDLGYAEYGGGPPLAAKLTEFFGTEKNGRNILQWTTVTETNSNYFEIERSSDSRSFEAIGRIPAAGTSSVNRTYSFTDYAPPTGTNYYRLAMVDKHFKTDLSKIISLTNKSNQSLRFLYTFLSTATNTAVIGVNSSLKQSAILAICDATGRIIYSGDIVLQPGNNNIVKQFPGLNAKGIYYVRILTASGPAIVNETFVRE